MTNNGNILHFNTHVDEEHSLRLSKVKSLYSTITALEDDNKDLTSGSEQFGDSPMDLFEPGELREEIRSNNLAKAEVIKEIPKTEKEVKQYYEAHERQIQSNAIAEAAIRGVKLNNYPTQ